MTKGHIQYMSFECTDDLIEFYLTSANYCFQLALQNAKNRLLFREYMVRYETWKLAAKSAIELSNYQNVKTEHNTKN